MQKIVESVNQLVKTKCKKLGEILEHFLRILYNLRL